MPTREEFDMLKEHTNVAHARIDTLKRAMAVWTRWLLGMILLPGLGALYWLWGLDALAQANAEIIESRQGIVAAVPRIEGKQGEIIEGINRIGKIADQLCDADPACHPPARAAVRPGSCGGAEQRPCR